MTKRTHTIAGAVLSLVGAACLSLPGCGGGETGTVPASSFPFAPAPPPPPPPPAVPMTNGITRESVSSAGVQADRDSSEPNTAGDGTFVSFFSLALNLAPNSTGAFESFLRNRTTLLTTRVSQTTGGDPANSNSLSVVVSANGFTSFESGASNLVANNQVNVFRHDSQTGQTLLVSVSNGGIPGNDFSGLSSISADGNLIAFQSSATNLVPGSVAGISDILIRDVAAGTTNSVSVDSAGVSGNGSSQAPRIAADGGAIAFASLATNLVAGDTNGVRDVFVHVRQTGQTTRVSVATGGGEGDGPSGGAGVAPSNVLDISDDGRFVVFSSDATNLVPGDTNGVTDIFRHDRQTGETIRVSVGTGGVQSNASSDQPKISGDGRFVVFNSDATNLDARDQNGLPDVFIHDTQTGETQVVSLNLDVTNTGNGGSFFPDISADGRVLVFASDASNLVVDDTNDARDIFSLLNPFLP